MTVSLSYRPSLGHRIWNPNGGHVKVSPIRAADPILVGVDAIGGDPAFIEPWSGSDSDIIERIRSSYVRHYGATEVWVFRIWLSLNDERRIYRPNNIGHPVQGERSIDAITQS